MNLKTIFLVAFFAFAVQGKAVEEEIQKDAPAIPSDEKDFEDSPAVAEDSPAENDSEDENQEDEENQMESNDEESDPKASYHGQLVCRYVQTCRRVCTRKYSKRCYGYATRCYNRRVCRRVRCRVVCRRTCRRYGYRHYCSRRCYRRCH